MRIKNSHRRRVGYKNFSNFACTILTSHYGVPMKHESETKRKLLETAIELIWVSSYGSVSVDDICTKAGVNKGSFYYAFKSKSELAIAAYERHWETKRPLLDQVFSSQVGPMERLRQYCESSSRTRRKSRRLSARYWAAPFVRSARN